MELVLPILLIALAAVIAVGLGAADPRRIDHEQTDLEPDWRDAVPRRFQAPAYLPDEPGERVHR